MLKNTIKKIFQKCAYQAVCFAEEQIGGGNGKLKKSIAIDYLINKLPLYLKPFAPFLKPLLEQIADDLIEKAVDKLHSVQNQLKEKAGN